MLNLLKRNIVLVILSLSVATVICSFIYIKSNDVMLTENLANKGGRIPGVSSVLLDNNNIDIQNQEDPNSSVLDIGDKQTLNYSVIVENGEPFLPKDIVNGSIKIGSPLQSVLSAVNYLEKTESFLDMKGSSFVFSKNMNTRSYFDSIKVSYENVYGSDIVNEIFLTKYTESKLGDSLELFNTQFIQYCHAAFGEPDTKYTARIRVYNSDKILYVSNLLWIRDGLTYIASYDSKKMREEAIMYMNENEARKMFGTTHLTIISEQEGVKKQKEIEKLKNEDSRYKDSFVLYF